VGSPLGPPALSPGRGEGLFAYNPCVLARAVAWFDRAAFKPATLPDDLVTGIALAPPVIAGLIIFKFPAFQMLLVAVAFGASAQLLVRWVWRHTVPRPPASPLIAAVIGVALAGPAAGLAVTGEIALLAVVLEVLRAGYMPAIRAQAGLIAYAGIALITRGAPYAYINPASGRPFGDPIATWYRFFSPESAPIDPIRLYVGNIPGPVFATSLLAVAVGIAWLAYARRVSLVVLLSFFVGALLPIYAFHWDFMFQLDSGPTWFVAGLLLADRRLLPGSWAARPLLGLLGGALAVGLRRNGYGIEAAFFAVAAIQAVLGVFVVVVWAASSGIERWKRTRRLRQREAYLKLVKPASRAS